MKTIIKLVAGAFFTGDLDDLDPGFLVGLD